MQVGLTEIAILSLYLASLRAVNATTGYSVINTRRRTTLPQVLTLIAGGKRLRLLIARDDDVYDKKSQRYAEDSRTAEQQLIAAVINL